MNHFDWQIKLQESPEDMPAGQTPHTTVVYAHNDLVDKVQPGDRVNITGVLVFSVPTYDLTLKTFHYSPQKSSTRYSGRLNPHLLFNRDLQSGADAR